MKHVFGLLMFSLLLFSCGKSPVMGTSDEGEIVGKYKTLVAVDNFLYAVNHTQLITFDMTDKENPVEVDKKDVGMDIENLYHVDRALFIGSQTNLHIYQIAENGIPTKKSDTPYIRFGDEITTCDPVIADQDIAYVTLSSDFWNRVNGCPTLVTINELRAYDVADLENPQLKGVYQLNNPMGLSIDGDYLFVSDGDAGVAIFEVDHDGYATLINTIPGFPTYDLSAENNKLLVVSEEEIRQYDYSDINDIKLYSTLSLR